MCNLENLDKAVLLLFQLLPYYVIDYRDLQNCIQWQFVNFNQLVDLYCWNCFARVIMWIWQAGSFAQHHLMRAVFGINRLKVCFDKYPKETRSVVIKLFSSLNTVIVWNAWIWRMRWILTCASGRVKQMTWYTARLLSWFLIGKKKVCLVHLVKTVGAVFTWQIQLEILFIHADVTIGLEI
jgi:hypothetical protein